MSKQKYMTEKQAWQWIADHMIWSPMQENRHFLDFRFLIDWNSLPYKTDTMDKMYHIKIHDGLCGVVKQLHYLFNISHATKYKMKQKIVKFVKNNHCPFADGGYLVRYPIDYAFDLRRNFCLQQAKELS